MIGLLYYLSTGRLPGRRVNAVLSGNGTLEDLNSTRAMAKVTR